MREIDWLKKNCTSFAGFAGEWLCGTPYTDIPEVEFLVLDFTIYKWRKNTYLTERCLRINMKIYVKIL